MSQNDVHYSNVVGAFYDQKWAMMPEALARYVKVVNRWSVGVKLDKEAAAELMQARAKPISRVDGKVAVLPLFGVIAQRMNLMQELSSGGTSTERFGQEFDKAVNNEDVDAIVINIDSPGGTTYGVEELANKIFEARGKKKIYAIANSLAASAAYHIGSAADQLFVTPSGDVGSIGVYAFHVDQSGLNDKVGLNVTYVSAGKYKVEGNPDMPLDEEAVAAIQESVNSSYDKFVADVARFRGVKERDVRNGFGEGRLVTAEVAKKEGMVDRVLTLEQLLRDLGVGHRSRKGSQRTVQQARMQRHRRFHTRVGKALR